MFFMNKNQLRAIFKKQRLELSATQHASMTQQIIKRVLDLLPLHDFEAIHCYLPIIKFAEINTSVLLKEIAIYFPKLQVFVPKVSSDNLFLEHYRWQTTANMAISKWGILEPVDQKLALQGLPTKLLVFVPLLAFDTNGQRVGYGKGFYDRFLAECSPSTLKVGLSFFEAVNPISDLSTQDQPLDICITPNRVYKFSNHPSLANLSLI
jgi:5-formyltetrahydrofolate cyclo-ligase